MADVRKGNAVKMKKKTLKLIFNKFSAFVTAGVMSFSAIAGFTATADYESDIAELQRKQEALAEERKPSRSTRQMPMSMKSIWKYTTRR